MVTSANGSQSTLNQYDISTATLNPIKALTIGQNGIVVNALGYSNTQNVFWGVRAVKNPPPIGPTAYPDEIVRVDSKGNVEGIGVPGNLGTLGYADFLALAGTTQGDTMYVHTKLPANHLFEIDVKPGSATLGEIKKDTPLSRITPGNADSMLNIGDWDFNDSDNELYGIELTSTKRKVVKVKIGTGVVTDVADVSTDVPDSDNYGAVFMEDGPSNLYGSANNVQVNNVNSGKSQTFVIRLDETPPLVQPFAKNASLKINDGADCLLGSDFGDAPDSYKTKDSSGGAAHVMSMVKDPQVKFHLGDSVDSDIDGFPSTSADTDDKNIPSNNDEDGIPAGSVLDGDDPIVKVKVTGGTYTLAGWLDANQNGTFDEAEMAKSTSDTLTWPAAVKSGKTMLRLRLYEGNVQGRAGLTPGGWVTGGEIEDHLVTLTPQNAVLAPAPDVPGGNGDPQEVPKDPPPSDGGGPKNLANTGSVSKPYLMLGAVAVGVGMLLLGLSRWPGRRISRRRSFAASIREKL